MGLKLLFTLAVIFLIYHLIQLISRHTAHKAPRKKPDTVSVEAVQCSHCGVYLPRAEAVSNDDHLYCCHKHLEADKQTRNS
ncbi:MAG: PP0621 family protein [Sedimenticola sp.]